MKKLILVLTVSLLLLGARVFAEERGRGGIRIIPSIVLNVPHPWNVALDVKPDPHFSFGIGAGTLGLDLSSFTNPPVAASMTNFEARARFHPFGGALFIGAAVGKQLANVSATETITVVSGGTFNVPTTVTVNSSGPYINPHIGWMWIFNSGITLGVELGAQIPIGATATTTTAINDPSLASLEAALQATAEYQQLETQANDTATKFSNYVLPFVTLLRFGYAF